MKLLQPITLVLFLDKQLTCVVHCDIFTHPRMLKNSGLVTMAAVVMSEAEDSRMRLLTIQFSLLDPTALNTV